MAVHASRVDDAEAIAALRAVERQGGGEPAFRTDAKAADYSSAVSFVVTHRLGDMERDVPVEALTRLLDELADDPDDHEHADVAVFDEGGWTLSVLKGEGGYRLIWEDVEESATQPVHMSDVNRDETLRIMSLVAHGRLEDVDALSWTPGY